VDTRANLCGYTSDRGFAKNSRSEDTYHTLETSEKCVHSRPQCPPSGIICEHGNLNMNSFLLTGPDLEIHTCIISLLYVCIIAFGVRPVKLFTHRRDCEHAFTKSNYVEARLYGFQAKSALFTRLPHALWMNGGDCSHRAH